MDKVTKSNLCTAVLMGALGLSLVSITAAVYSKDIYEKNLRIEALQESIDELKQRNATLQTEAEAKQTIIDNLEYEVEKSK